MKFSKLENLNLWWKWRCLIFEDPGQLYRTELSTFSFSLKLLKIYLFYIVYKNSVRTSQEMYYFSATKTNSLMLFMEKSLFILKTIRNTQAHFVERIQRFYMLK
jgi:hypothetical protein